MQGFGKNRWISSIREAFFIFFDKECYCDNSKILSISCGEGCYEKLIYERYENINMISTDVVDCMVSDDIMGYLSKRGVWRFVKVKPEKELPFENNTFDLIFHNDVLEHTEKPYLFLKEQFRVLKKGGHIIIGTPNLLRMANIAKIFFGKLHFPKKIENSGLYTSSHHIQEFTQWSISNMLKEIGFENIELKCCFFGLHIFNIQFKRYPTGGIGKIMAHYLTFCAKKPS